MEKKHYGAIDGLRTIACTGIVMMHMQANNHYEISGFFYHTVISSFTDFVFLFMTVSAFGMCCGYYEKVMKNQVVWSDFYKKRFGKVLPFFALLVVIDLLTSPSVASLYEGFADVTLVFGFLQKPIEVIGVGWFLGLVFVFYLIFPFFCVLLENKRRAWIAFGISLEIYLSHMALFRAVEKAGLNKLFGVGWLQYFVTVLLVLVGAVCFSAVAQKGIQYVKCFIH